MGSKVDPMFILMPISQAEAALTKTMFPPSIIAFAAGFESVGLFSRAR